MGGQAATLTQSRPPISNRIDTMKLQALTLTAMLCAAMTGAHATPLSYSSNILPDQSTNWSNYLDLQQFDPALGTLQSVTVELFAHLAGSAKAESHNNTAANITLSLQAQLKLANPNDPGSTLVTTTSMLQRNFTAGSYDGAQDYAGSSGVSFSNLVTSASHSATFFDTSTLALFTGQGLVHAPLSATAGSGYSGPGNVRTSLLTQAGGYATVSYEYQALAVPEPGTLALTLAGLAMLGLLTGRRKT